MCSILTPWARKSDGFRESQFRRKLAEFQGRARLSLFEQCRRQHVVCHGQYEQEAREFGCVPRQVMTAHHNASLLCESSTSSSCLPPILALQPPSNFHWLGNLQLVCLVTARLLEDIYVNISTTGKSDEVKSVLNTLQASLAAVSPHAHILPLHYTDKYLGDRYAASIVESVVRNQVKLTTLVRVPQFPRALPSRDRLREY